MRTLPRLTSSLLTAVLLGLGNASAIDLEGLVKKFAHQRFEPSGFTKNPDIRNASSIIDYVFRWMGCQFVAALGNCLRQFRVLERRFADHHLPPHIASIAWRASAPVYRLGDQVGYAFGNRVGPALFNQTPLTYLAFATVAIVAWVLFLVIKAMNTMKRKEEAKPAPVAETPADIKLLTEIRDLLKK